MKIQQNIPLAGYSTMKLGGNATYLCEVTSEGELEEAVQYATENNLGIHVVGSGSNSVFSAKGFAGLVIVNKIMGIKVVEEDEQLRLEVGAGEDWDSIVELTVANGFADMAALSLIPGTTGAAPIQNIGAYGQQISDVIESVKAYDTLEHKYVVLTNNECGFSYRGSRFNNTDKNRYIITSVKTQLSRKNIRAPFYADVSRYFQEHSYDETTITPAQLREAVSAVRVIKLPDPSTIASCGSFFKNPTVDKQTFENLQKKFPELKAHKTDDGNLKLYGAQLIELCGLKDFHDEATGMATWKNQALVLVNESADSTDDLLAFKAKVVKAVQQKFGITLIQEPEFIEN